MERYVYQVAPEHGARVVAIGGGTGLSTLLRGLKLHTKTPTATATVAADLLEESGEADIDPERLRKGDAMFVTPKDIDAQVRDLAKVVGYGINWALQDLEIEEMNALLS